jgi:thiosulfate dehydrogenase
MRRAHRLLLTLSATALAVLFGSVSAVAAETESAMARGGRLYDKYYAENKTAKPITDHPSYPKDGKYGKENSWRCKECHGWDYKGKDGFYAKGAHATGIKGINGAAGKDPVAIAALFRDKTHGYTEAQLSAKDASDLALFVSRGQGDLSKYLDASNTVKGSAAKGEAYYNTLCADCHGVDGKKIKTGPPLGAEANNGAQTMHKVLNGHPGAEMPVLRAFDNQFAADIAVHMNKLPK